MLQKHSFNRFKSPNFNLITPFWIIKMLPLGKSLVKSLVKPTINEMRAGEKI